VINGKRIVVCVPYGRRRTVSILLNYLRRDRGIVDEVQFWMNTDPEQVEDVQWAEEQQRIYEGWVRCVARPTVERLTPKQYNTGSFYALTQDPGTYYFRFDDDIVYVHPAYFREMAAFREANPDYLLVFGNIWNNAMISYLHQQAGRIGREHGVVEQMWCMDPVGWRSPEFAVYIHGILLDAIAGGTVDRLLFDDPTPLTRYERFSISNFLWTGEDCAEWGGATAEKDEELFLTEHYPPRVGLINAINGRGLVAHYSFFDQRPALDQTDILDRYRELSQKALSEAYYDLLGAS
jgi:hypothetical protein